MGPRFFGLSNEYMESVYENFFVLIHYGHWRFSEAYNLPIVIRKWFTDRLLKQFENDAEAVEKGRK